jgi:hypothetical protein
MVAGSGPDVTRDDMRLVALGTLVAADKSLVPVVNLAMEEGIWRDADPDSEWHPCASGVRGRFSKAADPFPVPPLRVFLLAAGLVLAAPGCGGPCRLRL